MGPWLEIQALIDFVVFGGYLFLLPRHYSRVQSIWVCSRWMGAHAVWGYTCGDTRVGIHVRDKSNSFAFYIYIYIYISINIYIYIYIYIYTRANATPERYYSTTTTILLLLLLLLHHHYHHLSSFIII
jgi:hypothetical protein